MVGRRRDMNTTVATVRLYSCRGNVAWLAWLVSMVRQKSLKGPNYAMHPAVE